MNLYKVVCYCADGNQRTELFIANSVTQAETFVKEKYEDDIYYTFDTAIVDIVDGYKISVSK